MKTKILLAFSLVLALPAYAQHETGNGGGTEIELRALQSDFRNLSYTLLDWVQISAKNQTLAQKLHLDERLPPATLLTLLTEIINSKDVSVSFTRDVLTVDVGHQQSEPRICINRPEAQTIRCNADLWKQSPAPIHYAIVLHEYLGLLGYETNEGVISQYPYSKHVLDYVGPTGEPRYELRQESMKADDSALPTVVGCDLSSIFDLWPSAGPGTEAAKLIEDQIDRDLRDELKNGLNPLGFEFDASKVTVRHDRFTRESNHWIENPNNDRIYYTATYSAETKTTRYDSIGNPVECVLEITRPNLVVENSSSKKIIFSENEERTYTYTLKVDVHIRNQR